MEQRPGDVLGPLDQIRGALGRAGLARRLAEERQPPLEMRPAHRQAGVGDDRRAVIAPGHQRDRRPERRHPLEVRTPVLDPGGEDRPDAGRRRAPSRRSDARGPRAAPRRGRCAPSARRSSRDGRRRPAAGLPASRTSGSSHFGLAFLLWSGIGIVNANSRGGEACASRPPPTTACACSCGWRARRTAPSPPPSSPTSSACRATISPRSCSASPGPGSSRPAAAAAAAPCWRGRPASIRLGDVVRQLEEGQALVECFARDGGDCSSTAAAA